MLITLLPFFVITYLFFFLVLIIKIIIEVILINFFVYLICLLINLTSYAFYSLFIILFSCGHCIHAQNLIFLSISSHVPLLFIIFLFSIHDIFSANSIVFLVTPMSNAYIVSSFFFNSILLTY